MRPSCRRRKIRSKQSRSEPSHQKQDDQNQQDQTQTPTGVISPSCAIGPRGKSADQQQNQNDEQDCVHNPSFNVGCCCGLAYQLTTRHRTRAYRRICTRLRDVAVRHNSPAPRRGCQHRRFGVALLSPLIMSISLSCAPISTLLKATAS